VPQWRERVYIVGVRSDLADARTADARTADLAAAAKASSSSSSSPSSSDLAAATARATVAAAGNVAAGVEKSMHCLVAQKSIGGVGNGQIGHLDNGGFKGRVEGHRE